MRDRKPERQPETWALEPHLCRGCGGRILRRMAGPSVVTPGGNPIFRCADCGKQTSSMSTEALCWCGFNHRGQHATAYRCVPFEAAKDSPALTQALLACGCDPKRGTSEVGIVLERDYRAAMHEPPPEPPPG